jgi:hypothetical protein
MQGSRWTLGVVFAAMIAALYACVGDDPTPSNGGDSSNDASTDGTASSDSQVADDGGAGVDSGCPGLICDGTCIDITQSPTNCGRCNHACGAGSTCKASACQAVLVSTTLDGGVPITALATDEPTDNPAAASAHVYFSQNGVFQDNVTGGNLIKLSKTAVSSASIAVNASTVYWFGPPPAGVPGLPILRGTVGTAASETSEGSVTGTPGALLYAGSLVGSYTKGPNYGFLTCDSTPSCTESGEWSLAGVAGLNMATDGTTIFTADSDNGAIEGSTPSGTNSANHSLGAAGSGTNLLRVLGTGTTGRIYWSNSVNPSLWRAPLDLSTPKQIATPDSAASGMDVDASNVYWAEPASGTIKYAPAAGSGTTTTYVTMSATTNPMLLVRDTTYLYFTHDASVYRVALP